MAAFVEGASSREWKEGLKQRRNILYDKVVFPLEELLQGTKWMNDYTQIDPLDISRRVSKFDERPAVLQDTEECKAPKKKRTPTERAAAKWLSRTRLQRHREDKEMVYRQRWYEDGEKAP
ncbi:hypothetical protein BO71DRAFT_443449 [Aspergillus ellipticus CBS 707.79]|uniref:Uncharacterized protein n=1 Tax=Aspergillus ellipticus CBS 707.79 TaxID=1448320 RepID=A0A319D189_9EURO|nr:hypothetical protein BO71DRAFT_443449 [Aspergillus ellipticus CBS 707.79]